MVDEVAHIKFSDLWYMDDGQVFIEPVGVDIYLPYFKFTPSLRGVFAITDELVRDMDPDSPYTGSVDSMLSRGVFLNFTFQ